MLAHFFDVSKAYEKYWGKMAPPERWSTFTLREEWVDHFDIVTSLFSLEHVIDLDDTLRNIHRSLKNDGTFYVLVPNMYDNIADLIVADHANHFSTQSLCYLLQAHGFEVITMSSDDHAAAFTVVAIKRNPPPKTWNGDQRSSIEQLRSEVAQMGKYWQNAAAHMHAFEDEHPEDAAIYGAGFYGTFIATCIRNPSRLKCFIDQNLHLQGKTRIGVPIISPDKLDRSIRTLYIGLNPKIARASINDITEWKDRPNTYFFF